MAVGDEVAIAGNKKSGPLRNNVVLLGQGTPCWLKIPEGAPVQRLHHHISFVRLSACCPWYRASGPNPGLREAGSVHPHPVDIDAG